MTYSSSNAVPPAPVPPLEQSAVAICPPADTKAISPLAVVTIGLAFLMMTAMWLYVNRVFVPQQAVEAAQRLAPRGDTSDLYPRWLGAREWLLHHRDPYGSQLTRQIQTDHWGRTLNDSILSDPADEAHFAYPAYVIFLLAPAARLSFTSVQVVFFVLLALLTTLGVWIWTGIVRPGAGPVTAWVVIILTLGSWSVAQALLHQQLSLLVAALVAGSVAALIRSRLGLAGILLALATIQPLLVAPLAAWYLVWVFGDIRRRYQLLCGFAATLAILIGAAELAVPGWDSQWWMLTRASLSWQSLNLAESLFGRVAGLLITLVVVATVVPNCWKARRVSATSTAFVYVVALVLSASLLVLPKWSPCDQVLMAPAILLLARDWMQRRLLHPVAKLVRFTGAILLGWQWFWAAVLVVISFRAPERAAILSLMPVLTVLMLPLAVFTALITRPAESAVSLAPPVANPADSDRFEGSIQLVAS